MTCEHWENVAIEGAGNCRLGLHGGRPSLGLCRGCARNTAAPTWPSISPSHLAPAASASPSTVAAHIAACEGCAHNLALRQFTFNGLRTVTVRCDQCVECSGGRSLTSEGSTCPKGRWQA